MRQAVSHLALAQRLHISDSWDPGQRDCAGLIRFAYREALKERTLRQRQRLGLPQELALAALSPLAQQSLPEWPKMWRTKDGSYHHFAASGPLIRYNFRFKSRRIQDADPGDLLVFQPEAQNSWDSSEDRHLMLYAGGPGRGYVVYHNGGDGDQGQVRVVELDDMITLKDPLWSPVSQNPHFLGVFEWLKIRPHQKTNG